MENEQQELKPSRRKVYGTKEGCQGKPMQVIVTKCREHRGEKCEKRQGCGQVLSQAVPHQTYQEFQYLFSEPQEVNT